jgi:FixJ family two-component response regulator
MEDLNATPTVFIVDDDASVRAALARLVRRAGWNAEACASARDFIERYDPAQPGCLVLDVSMPEVDGLELQGQLRDLGDPLPIVFLTGHADVAMSVAAMRAGAVNFLTKPVQGVAVDARARGAGTRRRRPPQQADRRRAGRRREDHQGAPRARHGEDGRGVPRRAGAPCTTCGRPAFAQLKAALAV